MLYEITFNRTIIELKFQKLVQTLISHFSFNRTIIELKFCIYREEDKDYLLLIEL